MSDYEDNEMDVDVSTVTFSASGEKKGKRSAANLPVEAEDTLPWWASSTSSSQKREKEKKAGKTGHS